MEHLYAVDCHNHSVCSPDGNDPVEAMCARAAELGLYAYTLTDHYECQRFEERYAPRVELAWAEMAKVKKQLPGDFRFYRGIEMGQPNQNLPEADAALQGKEYDFIIGSLHNIRGFEDFYFLDYTAQPPDFVDRLLAAYWQELLEVIEWGNFDSLGHLTYPLRYIEGDHGIPVDLSKHKKQIDEVLLALIRAEKALEVNTSGYRQKIGKALPDLPLLARYRELGGRLVTLGSDAHSTEDLGKGIDRGMELLREAGFTEFALYERRSPRMLPLK